MTGFAATACLNSSNHDSKTGFPPSEFFFSNVTIDSKPVHPGEMLREEFMIPLDLSANKLAIGLLVPVTRITEVLNERRSITADTALRLERFLGMSADFWMALQRDYDLQTARQLAGKQIAHDVRALNKPPQPEPARSLSPVRNPGRKTKTQKPQPELVKQCLPLRQLSCRLLSRSLCF